MNELHVPRERVEAALRVLLGAEGFREFQLLWRDDDIPLDVRMNSYKYQVVNPMKAYFVDNDVGTTNDAGKTMRQAGRGASTTEIIPRGATRQRLVDATYTDPRWSSPTTAPPVQEDDDDDDTQLPTNRVLAPATAPGSEDDDDDSGDDDDSDEEPVRRTYRIDLPGGKYLIAGQTLEYYKMYPDKLPMRLPGRQYSENPIHNQQIQDFAESQGWTPQLWLEEAEKKQERDRTRAAWTKQEEDREAARRTAERQRRRRARKDSDSKANTLKINDDDPENPFNWTGYE